MQLRVDKMYSVCLLVVCWLCVGTIYWEMSIIQLLLIGGVVARGQGTCLYRK